LSFSGKFQAVKQKIGIMDKMDTATLSSYPRLYSSLGLELEAFNPL